MDLAEHLLEYAPVGVFWTRSDGSFAYVNQAAADYLGYSRSELLARSLFDIDVDLEPQWWQRHWQRCPAQEPIRFERRHRHRDGHPIPVEVEVRCLHWRGEIVHASFVHDLTHLHAHQRELAQYREQLERLPVGVYRNTPGPDGVFLWVNAELARMLDAGTPAELIGRRVADFYAHSPARESFSHHLRDQGEVYRAELDLVTLAGRSIRVAITARARAAPGGAVVFEGAAEDVTREREQAERLRQADAVIENAHEGIVITDARRRIIRVNKAFTKITGYEPDEAIGCDPRLLSGDQHDAAFYRALWEQVSRNDHWQGEIWNRRKNGELYPELLSISAIRDDSGRVVNYAGLFSDRTEVKSAEASLRRLTDFDALTGLPNRKHLFDTLARLQAQCRGGQHSIVVMALGVDDFRYINEAWSPECGDEYLAAIAERLAADVPHTMQVFRIGDDRFALVTVAREPEWQLARIGHIVDDVVATPVAIAAGDRVGLQVSRGSAQASDGATPPETLLARAEAAMLHAKRHARGGHVQYSAALSEGARANLVIESELRRALADGELAVAVQPVVDVADDGLRGLEALARWHHPRDGMIPPDRFIPVAEASGLIGQLTLELLARACTDTCSLAQALGTELRLAFNVPATLVTDPAFVHRLLETVCASGLPLGRLALEITESQLMQRHEAFAAVHERLLTAGVHLSIDDFGTGYSSLASLQELRADSLKIDRRFIARIPGDDKNAQLTASIIAMATALGLEVIAEGVETQAQLDFLRAHGCDCYQGYLFSEPLRPRELTADLLRRGRGPARSASG